MKTLQQRVQDALTKNRTEELGRDVWRDFVVPLFFDEVDLRSATKPRVIVGGRGCGKTMLLRYLSHDSAFSVHRKEIPVEDGRHVGLYWRADTQSVNPMFGRGVSESVWQAAFSHTLAVSISIEFLRSLKSVLNSSFTDIDRNAIRNVKFDSLSVFDPDLFGGIEELEATLVSKDWKLLSWISNPESAHPVFYPGRSFILALIANVVRQVPSFSDFRFSVYIDEYENLREYQQQIINTCLKHSETPVVFNLAMKRNGMRVAATGSGESISDIADYRTIDLDLLLTKNSFDVFAAEILLSRLKKVSNWPVSCELADLKQIEALNERKTEEYRRRVINQVRAILPSLNREQLCEAVFAEPALPKKIHTLLARALKAKRSRMSPSAFISEDYKEASIIAPALLNRKAISPEALLAELKLLREGRDNRFTGRTGWIHNNFEGCLLHLYAPFDRACPFYSGFDTFVQLSCGNLRHFLELCYKALQAVEEDASGSVHVPPLKQAEAAKQASSALISQIKGFGRFGNRLHAFVLTLGSVFALSQARNSQSEPEISHFDVSGGSSNLESDDEEFLSEAEKWSVLFSEAQTKNKNPQQPFGSEWVLNPVYSPYFHITYRKRRKLSITVDDLTVLMRGTIDQRKALLKSFADKWSIDPTGEHHPLLLGFDFFDV